MWFAADRACVGLNWARADVSGRGDAHAGTSSRAGSTLEGVESQSGGDACRRGDEGAPCVPLITRMLTGKEVERVEWLGRV